METDERSIIRQKISKIERTIASYARVYDFLSEAQVADLDRLWKERLELKRQLNELRGARKDC